MQEVRSELAEMHQVYQAQAQYYQRRFQEYENQRNLQTHLEMTELQNQLNAAAMTYRSQAAVFAEQRIAHERSEHNSDRIFQNSEHMAEIAALQNRVQQSQHMMENAVHEHRQALQQRLDQTIIEQRAKVVAETNSVLQMNDFSMKILSNRWNGID